MKSIPRMLSQRWNSFGTCSVCDKIRSAHAQHVFICKNCSHFTAGWACTKIRSSYAQCAMKSLPRSRMLHCSVCDKFVFCVCSACACINFRKLTNTKLKCKFRLKKIEILKNRLGTHLIGPKWTFWRKTIFGYLFKNISYFWRKSKETKRIFFLENSLRTYKDLI